MHSRHDNTEFTARDKQAQSPSETTSLEDVGELDATGSHSFTVPPKLALPYRHEIPQETGSQVFDVPSVLQLPETPIPDSLQSQRHQKKHRNRVAIQNVHLVSPAEELISKLVTTVLFAVRPREIEQQQQDIFINTMVEDITLRATLQLPAVTLIPEKQVQPDQRDAVVSTASGAAIAGVGDLISAILRYVINVVMTNTVSPGVYGTFVATYTTVNVASFVGGLGLYSAALRFLPAYRAQGDHARAAGLIRFVVWMTLISGFLCGALFFLSASTLAHFVYHSDVYELPFKEATLLIPLMALQLTLASGLQALKAVKWKVYVDRLIQPGLTLVLMGVFYLLGLRLEALILATSCGFLASVITGRFLLGKASKQLVHDVAPKFESRVWLRFALPMFFNSIIQNTLNSTDVLFLAVFATTAQVGLYGAADRVSLFVVMPLLALNTIFSPLIAEYHARGEQEQLANMFKVVTKWSFSLSLPVFLCFCIFHDAILGVFAREYTAGGIVLIILSFGNLVDAGIGSVGYLLIMTGRPRVILANTFMTIAVNIGLALWLVPHFNVIGAAVAAAVAVIILNLTGLIEVYWIMRIHPYRWDMLKPLVAGGVASLVGLLLLQIIHAGYGYRAIFGVLALVIPFMLTYLLVLALLRFSKEDRMVFDAIRARLGKKKLA